MKTEPEIGQTWARKSNGNKYTVINVGGGSRVFVDLRQEGTGIVRTMSAGKLRQTFDLVAEEPVEATPEPVVEDLPEDEPDVTPKQIEDTARRVDEADILLTLEDLPEDEPDVEEPEPAEVDG